MSNIFTELAADRSLAAITSTASMIPVAGPGAPVAAAVFAPEEKGPFKGGPAITEDAVQRTVNSEGRAEVLVDGSGLPVRGSSVLLDSVFSQSSRMETALWDYADFLGLPGITMATPAESETRDLVETQFSAVKKALGAVIPDDDTLRTPEAAADMVAAELAATLPGVSSWTLSHRHVDAVLRTARLGGKALETTAEYRKLVSASPRNIAPLLRYAPNAVIFGFWAAALPTGSKLARSVTSSVTGYGASRVLEGSTKSTPLPVTSHAEVKMTKEGLAAKFTPKAPAEKLRPSSHGYGAVPSFGGHAVTCSDIISDSAVSVGHMRRLFAASPLNREQSEAALAAMIGLGVLGRALVLESGFYRSGCELVYTSHTWSQAANGGQRDLDIPASSEDLIDDVRDAVAAAQALGAFGTAEDRLNVDISPTFHKLACMSYIEQVLKRDAEGE